MADPTSRIEPASSYREPESNMPPGTKKEKQRPRFRAPAVPGETSAADERDDSEKHQLDTMA
jgi:hypothetical protein